MEKFLEKRGAWAAVEVCREQERRMHAVDKEVESKTLPGIGTNLEGISAIEVAAPTFGGRHTGGETFTSLHFDSFPEDIASHPHTLVGRDIAIVSGSGANQMAKIASVDPASRSARFAHPLRHVIDNSSAYVCLGVVQLAVLAHGEARHSWETQHWALKKPLKYYFESALGTVLGMARVREAVLADTLNIKNASTELRRAMIEGKLVVLLRLKTEHSTDDLAAALSTALDSGQLGRTIISAVQMEYATFRNQILPKTAYEDSTFPCDNVAIWGPNWREMVDSAQIQWLRPQQLVQKIAEHQEALRKALGKFGVDISNVGRQLEAKSSHSLSNRSQDVSTADSLHHVPPLSSARSGAPSAAGSKGERRGSGDTHISASSVGSHGTRRTHSTTADGSRAAVPGSHQFVLIRERLGAQYDLKEGRLGNASFVSAIWALVQRYKLPTLVRGLFEGPPIADRHTYGVFSLKLFVRGKWRLITIDDRLPVDVDRNLLFSACDDHLQLWAPLLEKALAKALGSYRAVGLCNPQVIMHCIIGGVTETFKWGIAFRERREAVSALNNQPPAMTHQVSTISREESMAKLDMGDIAKSATGLSDLAQKFGAGKVSKDIYVLRRTCMRMQCGEMEARFINLDLYENRESLWQTVAQLCQRGALVGVAMRSRAQSSHSSDEPEGLRRDRMYHVHATKTIRGVRMLQIRSRYGKAGWSALDQILQLTAVDGSRDPQHLLSEDKILALAMGTHARLGARSCLVNLPPRLLWAVAQSPWHVTAMLTAFQKWKVLCSNDASRFWMTLDSFCTQFNSVYYTYDLSANGQWLSDVCKGSWRSFCSDAVLQRSAGGSMASALWVCNPKFQFNVHSPDDSWRVAITVSDPPVRSAAATPFLLPLHAETSAPCVALVVVLESLLRSRGPLLQWQDFAYVSRWFRYADTRAITTPEFKLKPASYVIVPLLSTQGREGAMRVELWSTSRPVLRGSSFAGCWTEDAFKDPPPTPAHNPVVMDVEEMSEWGDVDAHMPTQEMTSEDVFGRAEV